MKFILVLLSPNKKEIGKKLETIRCRKEEINEKLLRDKPHLSEITEEISSSNLIPDDYRTKEALEYIKKVFENKRAEKLSDAINLYEEKLVQQKNEELQQESIRLQKAQIKQLKRMKSQTNAINTGKIVHGVVKGTVGVAAYGTSVLVKAAFGKRKKRRRW